jgi:selenocysteine lyase/cysteine desulfurase
MGQAAPAGQPTGHDLDSPGRPPGLVNPGQLSKYLFSRHKIFTITIHHKDFAGIRVTPNVYTTIKEIDLFAEAMHQVLTKGIS